MKRKAGKDLTDFQHTILKDECVRRVIQSGGTAEDCVVALSRVNAALVDRLMYLEGIAPRRIRIPGGGTRVWHCPDAQVPDAASQGARFTFGGGGLPPLRTINAPPSDGVDAFDRMLARGLYSLVLSTDDQLFEGVSKMEGLVGYRGYTFTVVQRPVGAKIIRS